MKGFNLCNYCSHMGISNADLSKARNCPAFLFYSTDKAPLLLQTALNRSFASDKINIINCLQLIKKSAEITLIPFINANYEPPNAE